MSVVGRNAHSMLIHQLRTAHRAEHPLHRAGEALLPSRTAGNLSRGTCRRHLSRAGTTYIDSDL